MTLRHLALGLAANRIAFGVGFLLAPGGAAQSWIGRPARTAGAQVMIRAAGARDLALGVGALRAMLADGDDRGWFAAHLVSDGADVVATWLARDELGRARAAYGLFMAGASTAIAAAYLMWGPPRTPST
jgi:hypothetical protein